MSRNHPGLNETVLQECLDIWLREHLSNSLDDWRIRDLAEELAAFLWKMIEPQPELGFKPPFGGSRQVQVIELCNKSIFCMKKRGHLDHCE